MNIKNFAKINQEIMSNVLKETSIMALHFDGVDNESDICITAYMDYDEQDCFNAIVIFSHVMSCYGIHHGFVTDENTTEMGLALRDLCMKYGINPWQEAAVKKMLNNID